MSTLDQSATMLPAAFRPAIWERVAGRGVAVMRFLRNRSAFVRLNEMTDKQLKDIGLRRYDVLEAGHGFGDPITRLTMIVDERQSGEAAARHVV
ncbi:DUF1127 domain-containing protein [Tianweitania sp. BSSL-BM11]|uniref:DUF1127 domain-containing protein n=1 Tax=Tianweitania aestuarii TaxID=2814886 RepID=A0ABS5RQZ2_9HYPH|nr:DUF1127 domain-containing protein [Tianweitania aestuarii]MBS9719469.1 DUF1127 domain-containing protein [Tianweitania aestuarii]